MSGKKKDAKLAHRGRTPARKSEAPAFKQVMVDGGCFVPSTVSLFTACGRRREGWRYDETSAVTCAGCKETDDGRE